MRTINVVMLLSQLSLCFFSSLNTIHILFAREEEDFEILHNFTFLFC